MNTNLGKVNSVVFGLCLLSCILLDRAHADVGESSSSESRAWKITLQWFPQAQFAGYYVALEKGYYRELGLEVELRHKLPHESVPELLTQGKTDFITDFLSGGVKMRAEGLPIVNICQLSRKSALLFIARKSSGINRVQDINGRRVGIWMVDFKLIPEMFLKKYQLAAHVVPILNDVDLFLWGGVDVVIAMRYNEFFMIMNAGINEDELTIFDFGSHGLDIPEDGIYCLLETYQDYPEVCRKIVQATMKGWREAFRDKKQTLRLVRDYCRGQHRPFNLAHQRWMLETMEDLIAPERPEAGRLAADTYQRAARLIKEAGMIAAIPPFDSFHKDVLVNRIEE